MSTLAAPLPQDRRLDTLTRFKWHRLGKAARRARLDLVDLIERCQEGKCQFWDNAECSAVTAIVVSGSCKVCHILIAGGTLAGLRALDGQIEAFARANNCHSIIAHGRPGFKALENKSQGFRPVATLYEKVLKNG